MAKRASGFSLYELLLTLALMAIVVGLGLPSLSGMVARSRIDTEIYALFHAIHLARKESVVRRQVVTICGSSDGRSCNRRNDWSQGWIMFNNQDRDSPPQRDDGEPLLWTHFSDVTVIITANRRTFTLRSTQKRATNGTFVICDQAARVQPKALVVSYTGRPRVARRDRRGDPYECAH